MTATSARTDIYIRGHLHRFMSLTAPWEDIFLEKLERIVSKKEKYVLKVDEGWYSAVEMKSELKWSQPHTYLSCSQQCIYSYIGHAV